MKYPIVLANSYAQAASYALCHPNKRANYPYAAAYFKKLYGKVNPDACYLSQHGRAKLDANKYSCTREELYRALDTLIKSEGRRRVHPLSYYEQKLLFPFVIHREEQRQDHRCSAKIKVRYKVEKKQYERLKQDALEGFLDLPLDQLCDWVADHETVLNKFDIYHALRDYYTRHNTSDYDFQMIFPNYEKFPLDRVSLAIVCELSR